MLWSNWHGANVHHNYWACALVPGSCKYWAHVFLSPCSSARKATTKRSLCTAVKSSPQFLQLEKSPQSDKDPIQPKINKILINLINYIKKIFTIFRLEWCSDQFSLVAELCPTLCDPMNHSTPGLPVHHHLPEFTQTHVHQVGDAIQPSHPLSSPSPPAPNPSQHQGLLQWVNSSHEVAKVLEFQI